MAANSSSIEKRIRMAGALVALGIAIQAVSLLGTHPLSFMAFIVVGCPITGAGVLLYALATRES